MLQFIQSAGVFFYPLLILAIVNLVLVFRRGLELRSGGPRDASAATVRIDAILFWGVMAAVMGLLGQASGIYNALQVISRAREISPSVVAQGLAESFTTTLMGLTILLLSGLAWLILRYRRAQLAGALSAVN